MFGDERGGDTNVNFGFKDMKNDEASSMYHDEVRKMIRDINTELRTLTRLNRDGVISDTRLEKERATAQTKIDRLREGLTVDGGEKP